MSASRPFPLCAPMAILGGVVVFLFLAVPALAQGPPIQASMDLEQPTQPGNPGERLTLRGTVTIDHLSVAGPEMRVTIHAIQVPQGWSADIVPSLVRVPPAIGQHQVEIPFAVHVIVGDRTPAFEAEIVRLKATAHASPFRADASAMAESRVVADWNPGVTAQFGTPEEPMALEGALTTVPVTVANQGNGFARMDIRVAWPTQRCRAGPVPGPIVRPAEVESIPYHVACTGPVPMVVLELVPVFPVGELQAEPIELVLAGTDDPATSERLGEHDHAQHAKGAPFPGAAAAMVVVGAARLGRRPDHGS